MQEFLCSIVLLTHPERNERAQCTSFVFISFCLSIIEGFGVLLCPVLFFFLDLDEDGFVSRDEMTEVLSLMLSSTSLGVSSRVGDVLDQVFSKVSMIFHERLTITARHEPHARFAGRGRNRSSSVRGSREGGGNACMDVGKHRTNTDDLLWSVVARGTVGVGVAHRNREQPERERCRCRGASADLGAETRRYHQAHTLYYYHLLPTFNNI